MIQKTLIASAIALVVLSGCSDDNSITNTGSTDSGSTGGVEGGSDTGSNNGNGNGVNSETGSEPLAAERSLRQLENSEAFFAALREGLSQQNPAAENSVGVEESILTASQDLDTSDGAGTAGDTTGGTAGTGDGGSFAESASIDGAATDQSADSAGPADVTGTNVQEVGVDEQDRMKSDGEYLYIIDNQYGDYFPVDEVNVDIVEPTIDGVTQTTDSVDQVSEVEPGSDGEAVDFAIELLPVTPVGSPEQIEPVMTSVAWPEPYNTTKIRILALKNDVPDAEPVTDLQLDLDGGSADGMYLFKKDGQRNLIVTSTSYNDYLYNWDYSYGFNNARSLISKLDVTNPTQAKVAQSVKIDGQIISSRRIDDKLFVASRYYPSLPFIEPYALSPEEYQSAIAEADLTQTLPKLTSSDGTVTDLISPGECFVAARGQSSSYYYTPDIVSLAVIDLNTLQLTDSECFLGSSEALYATPNSVYLATTRWDDYGFIEPVPFDTVSANTDDAIVDFRDPRVDTDIHQFAINGAELTYSGSGVVSGHLGWNPLRKPFRMSEKDGYLRVATFSETQNESVSPIKLSVLNVAGDGDLVKVSELPNANNPEHIGKPGEQLYASRFIGDRAYLVTFRQTDPLYVVDISDPAAPKLAGELEIDGYSDYLQPIGENHLLGIGRDAVPGPVEWGDGALVQGVKLSLFDIADASNPTEVQSIVVGERGTEAAALQNHRAITVQAATDSHPARVAFGIDVHGLANPRPATNDPSVWFPWNYSGLHGFDINVGSGAGIEARGAMIVNSASNPRLSTFSYGGQDRSVIVGDAVYYIRSSEVFASTWGNLGDFVGPR